MKQKLYSVPYTYLEPQKGVHILHSTSKSKAKSEARKQIRDELAGRGIRALKLGRVSDG